MNFRWLPIAGAVLACAGIVLLAAEPALAGSKSRHKNRVNPNCIDRPYVFSWDRLLFGPAPQWNGCSPPVFEYGQFIGQDPDPNVRLYLRRDPSTGYATGLAP